MKTLLSGLNARKIEDRADAQRKCELLCLRAGAPGSTDREPLCTSIGKMLESGDNKPPAKIFLLKQLERIGREESLDSLSAMLKNERAGVRDAARRALAANPVPQATGRLIEHYENAKGQDKASTLNALGYRFDAASVELLTRVANESKGPLKHAAINAISKAADEKVSPKTLRGISDKDALLRFADRMAEHGKKGKALAIYSGLLKSNAKSPFALAALRGFLALADEEKAIVQLLESLSSESKTMRQVATSHIRRLSPHGVSKLEAQFEAQADDAKRLIVMALGTRADAAGLTVVTKAAKSEDESMRNTAVESLGKIGTADSLTILLPMLLDEEERDLASSAILRLRGDGIDERITGLFEAVDKTDQQTLLIRLLIGRRVVNTPLYAWAATHKEKDVRDQGIVALSVLGDAESVNAILKARKLEQGADRDKIDKRILNMCRRNPEAAKVLQTTFHDSDLERKIELASLVGRVGGSSSLKAIRVLNNIGTDEAVGASVAAMANWPNHEVAEDLKKIAETSKKESQKIRALRGLVRVCVLGGDDVEKLDYLKFVFVTATRSDEKILAIERAKSVRTLESLQFVLPHIEHEKLGPRAQRTVVDLAHHRGLREPNRTAFEPALRKVADLLKDDRQQERIRKYLANE